MSKHVFGHNSGPKASQKVILPSFESPWAELGVKRSGLGNLITHAMVDPCLSIQALGLYHADKNPIGCSLALS